MKTKLVASLAALLMLVAACGNDDDEQVLTGDEGTDSADAGTGHGGTETATEPAEDVPVQVGSTELGDVLVDADGMTLYAFEPDTDGVPTCEDDCLAAWPPLLVDSEELPDGLDPDVFSVVEASDGTFQVAAGGWPLYGFASDSEPGDTAGHLVDGFGGLWWVVTPDGEPVLGDEAAGEDGSEEDDDSSDSGY